jgi:hypothetical protein
MNCYLDLQLVSVGGLTKAAKAISGPETECTVKAIDVYPILQDPMKHSFMQ